MYAEKLENLQHSTQCIAESQRFYSLCVISFSRYRKEELYFSVNQFSADVIVVFQVTYTLADHTDLFHIDPKTGNITTLKTFDREEKDFYNVKVYATDNSPSSLYSDGSHNTGQQVFRIEIADKNDNPPHFTEKMYIAEAIPEDSNINSPVTEVKALDNDTGQYMKSSYWKQYYE
jgi:hypothetical protein